MIAIECPKVKFSNARIVGSGVNPKEHHKQQFKRGEAGFVMSRGELMTFAECPAKWIKGIPEEQSSFMQWGDLIDCLITADSQLYDRFAIAPETYTVQKLICPKCSTITDSLTCRKCGGIKREPINCEKPWDWNAGPCQEWKEINAGKSTIKSDTFKQATIAVDRLLCCPEVAELLNGALFQVSLAAEYFDPQTELTIQLRALVDIDPRKGEYQNSLVDLKTSNSAEPRKYAKKVSDDHLDAQGALYLDLWQAATGEERADFRHIVQESAPPYHVELRVLSSEFIDIGRRKYRAAIMKYCQCLATNEWPGYDPDGRMAFGQWMICEPEPHMLKQ